MELRMFRKRTPLSLGIASAALNFLAPQFAFAEDYFDLSLEQLLETRVLSVSKKNETIAEAPAAIYVVTSEDIARSGVTTIPDALRMVPGVNVARSDSNSWAISIRGFNSTLENKLLVLIDGRTIYNPVFGGVLWEAENLMLMNVDRIEVVRGPGGSLWGANAVNGVINIITKSSRDTQGSIVSATAGNEEKIMSARHGGKFGGDGTYRVYVEAFNRDNSHYPSGGETYDQWDGVRTGFRADWDEGFTVQGDAYRTEAQQRKTNYTLTAPYLSIEPQNIIYEGVNVLGRWATHYSDGAQLNLQTYVDWTHRDEAFNFIDDRITYDIEAQYNLAPWGRHEIAVGAGYRLIDNDDTGGGEVSFSPSKNRDNLYSAFFQDKINLITDRWFLTLGSKFEHNDYSGTEIQPNIRLQWHPTGSQMWWLSSSKAVRTPTLIEQNITATVITIPSARGAIVPNKDFQSERLIATELGYRNQMNAKLSFDVAAFQNEYENLQIARVQPQQVILSGPNAPYVLLPVKFTNDMHGKSHGLELAVNWTATENLKLGVTYSALRISVTAIDPTQETPEKVYPQHQAGLKSIWNINDSWTLDTTTTYVDKLPGMNINAYTRLDINLGSRLTKNLRMNLVGQNLLESKHMEYGNAQDINAAEIERSIFAKLTWAI